MIPNLPSVGGHNTLVSLVIVIVSIWAYRIISDILAALKILGALQPTDSSDTNIVDVDQPSVLQLPGVNHLMDELKILSRRHLEQVVASSAQLRHAPVVPAKLSLRAHIDSDTITLSESTVTCNVEVAAGVPVKVFAAFNMPFTILDSNASHAVPVDRMRWWKEALFSALLPCSKMHSEESVIATTDRAKEVDMSRLMSPLRALASGGTRAQQSQTVRVTVAQMTTSDSGMIPLAVGVAYEDGLELSLCRVASSGRVEVIKQLILPEGLVICGLYGFEESSTPECMICCDRRVNTVLLPCCHCSLCQVCAQNLRDGKCPICRSVYASYVALPVCEDSASRQPQPSLVNASASTPLLS